MVYKREAELATRVKTMAEELQQLRDVESQQRTEMSSLKAVSAAARPMLRCAFTYFSFNPGEPGGPGSVKREAARGDAAQREASQGCCCRAKC